MKIGEYSVFTVYVNINQLIINEICQYFSSKKLFFIDFFYVQLEKDMI